jgi:hypothetical protein
MQKELLAQIPTEELIKELENRPGIKKISTGCFQSYELREKYTNNREPIEADTVLVLPKPLIKDGMELRRFESVSQETMTDKEMKNELKKLLFDFVKRALKEGAFKEEEFLPEAIRILLHSL